MIVGRLVLDVGVVARLDEGGGLRGRRQLPDLVDALLGLRMRREQAVPLLLVLVALGEPRQEVAERAGA